MPAVEGDHKRSLPEVIIEASQPPVDIWKHEVRQLAANGRSGTFQKARRSISLSYWELIAG